MIFPNRARRLPFNRQQMADAGHPGGFALPMAALQADGSHFPDSGLSRDFILADRNRASDDRTGTYIAIVDRQMKILFSHWVFSRS
jgi:hypothetical protein